MLLDSVCSISVGVWRLSGCRWCSLWAEWPKLVWREVTHLYYRVVYIFIHSLQRFVMAPLLRGSPCPSTTINSFKASLECVKMEPMNIGVDLEEQPRQVPSPQLLKNTYSFIIYYHPLLPQYFCLPQYLWQVYASAHGESKLCSRSNLWHH